MRPGFWEEGAWHVAPPRLGHSSSQRWGVERAQEEGLDRRRFRGETHVAISGSRKKTLVLGQGEDGTAGPALWRVQVPFSSID